MSAYHNLKQHILKRVTITSDELDELSSAFKQVNVKKKQFLVQPGFTPKHRYYVSQGAFRAYVVDEQGAEHTIQMAIDDWWITDYNNYLYQEPAAMFIVAIEDSIVLQIDHTTEQELKKRRHVFETYFRILAETTAAYMARRVITNLTLSAEERYELFINRYPAIVNRVPQYALASFLGMTTEYLSRLRKRRVNTKS